MNERCPRCVAVVGESVITRLGTTCYHGSKENARVKVSKGKDEYEKRFCAAYLAAVDVLDGDFAEEEVNHSFVLQGSHVVWLCYR